MRPAGPPPRTSGSTSRTRTSLEWQNSTLLGADVPAAVAKLREQPGGDIHVIGSGDFAQTLIRHDLVDVGLPEMCREALDTGEALERIGSTSGGALVSVRVRELELGGEVAGLIVAVAEITDLGLEPQSRIARAHVPG